MIKGINFKKFMTEILIDFNMKIKKLLFKRVEGNKEYFQYFEKTS